MILGDGWQVDGRSSGSWTAFHHNGPTEFLRSRIRTRAKHSRLQGGPPLMVMLGIYQNIPASDTKLTPSLCITSLALLWDWTNSSQLTLERSRLHRSWASFLRSNTRLQSPLNQGISLLRTRITLVRTKRPTSRDKFTFNVSTGLSALQMLRQGSSPIASQTAVQSSQCFRSTLLLTHKLGIASAIGMVAESDE